MAAVTRTAPSLQEICASYIFWNDPKKITALPDAVVNNCPLHEIINSFLTNIRTFYSRIKDHPDTAKYILENHQISKEAINNILLDASAGPLNIIKLLIETKNADIDTTNKNKETPLLKAAKGGSLESVAYLIFCKANIRAETQYKETILHMAAKSKSKNLMSFLLIIHNLDLTVLSEAEFEELIPFLIDKNFDMKSIAESKFAKIIRVHREEPLNINAKEHMGKTPLYAATSFHNLDIVKLLVEHGADIKAKEYLDGETVLNSAAKKDDSIDFFQCFLPDDTNKENIDSQTKNNRWSPLHMLANYGKNQERLESAIFLEAKGANPFLLSRKGENLLHLSARRGNVTLFNHYLKMGLDVNATTENGSSVLDYAYQGRDQTLIDIVTSFIK